MSAKLHSILQQQGYCWLAAKKLCELVPLSSTLQQVVKENYIPTFDTAVGYVTMQEFLKIAGQTIAYATRWLLGCYLLEQHLIKWPINWGTPRSPDDSTVCPIPRVGSTRNCWSNPESDLWKVEMKTFQYLSWVVRINGNKINPLLRQKRNSR